MYGWYASQQPHAHADPRAGQYSDTYRNCQRDDAHPHSHRYRGAITSTPTVGTGTYSPVTFTITAPFSFDGVGTFCWQASALATYINSWNTSSVTVNGSNYTNLYAAVSSLPAKINGYWYIRYTSTVAWGHFEAK